MKSRHQKGSEAQLGERAVAEGNLLLRICRATCDSSDLERLLKISVKIAGQGMGVDRCSVWLADDQKKHATVRAVYTKGRFRPTHLGARIEIKRFSKFKRIISEGKVLHSPDISKVAGNRSQKQFFAQAKIKSSLSVPLKIKKKVLGALNFGTLTSHKTFTTAEIRLCQIIANHIAMGIENARLYKKLEGRAARLQEQSIKVLRESEEKYRTLLENLPQLIFLKDRRSVYISVNKNFCKSMGVKPEQIIGKTDFDFFPREMAQKYRKDDREILRTGKTKEIVEDYIEKGKRKIVQTVKTPVLGDDGKPIGVLGIFWDITERKRMERALIQRELIARERAMLLTDLRGVSEFGDILTRVCEAVRNSGLFERAVMTFNRPGGEIMNLGQVGLPASLVQRARKAPPLDPKLRARITSKRFRISDSFFVPAEARVDFRKTGRYIPQKTKELPDGDWQSGDELFVPLRDFSGKTMGYLSVDTPVDGCRPDKKTIQALETLVEAAASRIREVETQKAMKRERDFSRSILGTANSLIVCLDHEARITVFNRECERVTGYRRDEVMGKRWPDLFLPPEYRHEKLKSFASWVRAHPRDQYEGPIMSKKGEIRTILWSNTAILGPGEKDLTAIAIGQDITERKETEEAFRQSEQRFRTMAEASPDYIFQTDKHGKTIYCSPAIEGVLGYTPAEREEKHFSTVISGSDLSKAKALFEKVIKGDTIQNLEINLIHKTGRKVPIEVSVVPIFENGEVGSLFGIVRDITGRKSTEEALRQSEETARALLNSYVDVALLVNPDGTIVSMNDALAKAFNKKPDELIGKCAFDFMSPDVAQNRKAQMDRATRSGKPIRFEDQRKGRWFDSSVFPILNEKGRVVRLAIYAHDITERRKTEEALELSQERYKLSTRAAKVGVWDWDLKSNRFYIDPNIKEILGYKDKEIPNDIKVWTTYVHPEDLKPVMAAAQACIDGKTPEYVFEHRMMHKDGSVRWILSRGQVIRDEDGKPVRMIGTDTDITESKKAEGALKESQDRYRSLFEDSPISLWEEDFSGVKNYVDQLKKTGVKNFRTYFDRKPNAVRRCAARVKVIDVNKASLRFFKARKKEELQQGLYKTFGEESFEAFKEELIAIAKGETVFESEAVTQTLRGERNNVVVRWSVAPGYEQTFSKVLVSVTDITERKQAEEALRDSEEKFRVLAENSPNMIFINKKGKVVYANKKCEEVMGYKREDFYSADFDYLSIVAPEYVDFVKIQFRKHMRGEDVAPYEYAITDKDGKRIEAIASTRLITYEGDNAILGVITDITERKKAEETVKESQKFLNDIIDHIPDPIFIKNRKHEWILLNRALSEMLGYPRDQMLGKSDHDFFPKKQADFFWKKDEQMFRTGKVVDIPEEPITDAEGNVHWLHTKKAPLKDPSGKISTLVGIIRDITDQKKAVEALRKSRDLNTILQISYRITQIHDLDEMLELACEETAKALGVDRCSVSIIDEEKKTGEVKAVYVKNQPHPKIMGTRYLLKDFPRLVRLHGRKEKFVYAPQVEKASLSQSERDYFRAEGVKSFVIVPIDTGKKLLGAILVASMEKERVFAEPEIAFVQTLANHLAIAVENVKLMGLVKEQAENLKVLSQRVITAQEEERRRLAQELHDDIGQILTVMKLNMEMSKKGISPESAQILDRIEDNEALVDQTLDKVRNLTTDLRPPMLDDFGLIPTLRWYIDNFSERTEVKVALRVDNYRGVVPKDVEMVLYRITQEALTNVAKHAKATQVSITLEKKNDYALLTVRDDGIGFDADLIMKEQKARKGFGLFNIKERVKLLNGNFSITSKPKKGTRLQVRIPCPKGR